MSDVLLLCLSKKPGEHQPHKVSAVRQLLRVCETSVVDLGLKADFVDLREVDFPLFDGRSVAEYGPAVAAITDRLSKAKLVLFGFPAYWGGLNGYGKNFLDVIGGAAYDAPDRRTPLNGKPVAAVVVGGSQGDSDAGLAQFRHCLTEMGALPQPHAVALDNPRTHPDMHAVVTECYLLPRRLMRGADTTFTGQPEKPEVTRA